MVADPYQVRLKRVMDIVISLVSLIVLSPIIVTIGILVLCVDGTPIFFRQDRIGYKGRLFTIFKFRTMSNKLDGHKKILEDSERLTTLGKMLRKTTLDEIPELFNVLLGEMSLVGPRPLLTEYRELYSSEQFRRHDMPPGMAGPVLVKGRNTLSWPEKFKQDLWYVDNWSLFLDLKILILTFWKVIKGEGVVKPGHATTDTFRGNEERRAGN